MISSEKLMIDSRGNVDEEQEGDRNCQVKVQRQKQESAASWTARGEISRTLTWNKVWSAIAIPIGRREGSPVFCRWELTGLSVAGLECRSALGAEECALEAVGLQGKYQANQCKREDEKIKPIMNHSRQDVEELASSRGGSRLVRAHPKDEANDQKYKDRDTHSHVNCDEPIGQSNSPGSKRRPDQKQPNIKVGKDQNGNQPVQSDQHWVITFGFFHENLTQTVLISLSRFGG